MSDESKDALEAALAAHFADEFDGAILSSYVLQAYGQKIDSDSGFYLTAWPVSQPIHVTGGLIDYTVNRHVARMAETVGDADDE